MKNIAFLIFFLSTTVMFSQKVREIGDFNEVKVYDRIDVKMVQSNTNKVEIHGEDLTDVEIVNKNGVLKIRMDIEKTLHGEDNYVILYFTGVNIIDGNEGAFISTETSLKQESIELRSQEGARLDIKLEVTSVDIKAVTGGGIKTTGSAKYQDININTGGIYEGEDFITENTTIAIKAAGEAAVNASKQVDAKVRAGGDIRIYGNPEKVNEDTALGGRITRVNQ
ncbi:head GIN domain-containing protein [Aegicerativicinus sediminis]|uniref:head GIN domain-containing protein n=1 Tax=Aegicerativicinus sediminis TaxID=2893202 RepID=UPI001E4C47D2|nr:head GIN domain-containing protein [Aegicerativicinus sediminis]